MVAHTCNPIYSGGRSRRIACTLEAEVAMKQDHATALQPGRQSKTLSQEKIKSIPEGVVTIGDDSTMNAVIHEDLPLGQDVEVKE